MPLCKSCIESADINYVGPHSRHIDHVETEYEAVDGVCSNCGSSPAHRPVDETIVYDEGHGPLLARICRRIFG